MSGLLGNWLIPVNPRAKNPRVFKVPFRAEWEPSSQWLLHRMGNLGSRWGPRLRSNWEQIARRNVVPMARRVLGRRYNWTGRAARAIRITGTGDRGYMGPGEKTTHGPWVEIGLDPDVLAEDPLYGRWAAEQFSVPTALHEGIKRHRVWIRHWSWGNRRRENLARWAIAHLGHTDPGPGKSWSIMVYRRGRKKSRHPYLWTAALVQRERFTDAIGSALHRSLGQSGAPLIFNMRSGIVF